MNKRYPAFDDCIHLERFTGCDYCAAKNLVAWASNKTHAISVKNLLDGSVITLENASTPRFSPDGETLFYLSSSQMQLCRPDGTNVRPLGQFSGPIIDPIWSPDGTRILFGSAKSGSIGASAAESKTHRQQDRWLDRHTCFQRPHGSVGRVPHP